MTVSSVRFVSMGALGASTPCTNHVRRVKYSHENINELQQNNIPKKTLEFFKLDYVLPDIANFFLEGLTHTDNGVRKIQLCIRGLFKVVFQYIPG